MTEDQEESLALALHLLSGPWPKRIEALLGNKPWMEALRTRCERATPSVIRTAAARLIDSRRFIGDSDNIVAIINEEMDIEQHRQARDADVYTRKEEPQPLTQDSSIRDAYEKAKTEGYLLVPPGYDGSIDTSRLEPAPGMPGWRRYKLSTEADQLRAQVSMGYVPGGLQPRLARCSTDAQRNDALEEWASLSSERKYLSSVVFSWQNTAVPLPELPKHEPDDGDGYVDPSEGTDW